MKLKDNNDFFDDHMNKNDSLNDTDKNNGKRPYDYSFSPPYKRPKFKVDPELNFGMGNDDEDGDMDIVENQNSKNEPLKKNIKSEDLFDFFGGSDDKTSGEIENNENDAVIDGKMNIENDNSDLGGKDVLMGGQEEEFFDNNLIDDIFPNNDIIAKKELDDGVNEKSLLDKNSNAKFDNNLKNDLDGDHEMLDGEEKEDGEAHTDDSTDKDEDKPIDAKNDNGVLSGLLDITKFKKLRKERRWDHAVGDYKELKVEGAPSAVLAVFEPGYMLADDYYQSKHEYMLKRNVNGNSNIDVEATVLNKPGVFDLIIEHATDGVLANPDSVGKKLEIAMPNIDKFIARRKPKKQLSNGLWQSHSFTQMMNERAIYLQSDIILGGPVVDLRRDNVYFQQWRQCFQNRINPHFDYDSCERWGDVRRTDKEKKESGITLELDVERMVIKKIRNIRFLKSRDVALTASLRPEEAQHTIQNMHELFEKDSLKPGIHLMPIPNNDDDVEKINPIDNWNQEFPLRSEQKRSLNWMIGREKSDDQFTANFKHVEAACRGEMNFHLDLSVHYLRRGGILADEVGFGKTSTLIGLHAARASEDKLPVPAKFEGKKKFSKATLIFAPGHLLSQWRDEFYKFMPLKTRNGKLKSSLSLTALN